MLTLYHAPMSRSSRIVTLIDEMGIADQIKIVPVSIVRFDGTGQRDPNNPHPEGKVPVLIHDGTMITESGAIILYLTALFPNSGMAPLPGTPLRGEYLTWLFWYGSVMEPVLTMAAAGISHPYMTAGIRGVAEVTDRLAKALEKGPWLLGDTYGAADLLVHSPYFWFKDATPDVPAIRDWVARCQSREAVARTRAADVARMAA
jgi:glutathione S-transferase